MCHLAEFNDVETLLILERFCFGKTVGQCDFLSENQQRSLLPSLNSRVRSWIQHNTGFFCLEELAGMAEGEPRNNHGKTTGKPRNGSGNGQG